MHPLSPDEVDVYASLVESCPSAQVTVMHNHCMSEQVRAVFHASVCVCVSSSDQIKRAQGMIEGFRFTMNAKENNQYLPINRRMFFRHSMVECLPSNPAANVMGSCESPLTTSAQEDRTILELLLRQNEVKDKLVSIMQRLHKVIVYRKTSSLQTKKADWCLYSTLETKKSKLSNEKGKLKTKTQIPPHKKHTHTHTRNRNRKTARTQTLTACP